MTRRLIGIVVMATVAVAFVASGRPLDAGGWATVTLDGPVAPRAEEAVRIGFTVRQHGVTPVHALGDEPVKASLSAKHRESGETLSVEGRPEGAVGHFVVDVHFPRAGTWDPTIIPAPFAGTALDPVTVQATAGAPAAPAAGLQTTRLLVAFGAGTVLLLAAGALLFAGRHSVRRLLLPRP